MTTTSTDLSFLKDDIIQDFEMIELKGGISLTNAKEPGNNYCPNNGCNTSCNLAQKCGIELDASDKCLPPIILNPFYKCDAY